LANLLVVEDERELGVILARHLEGEGHHVRWVSDGPSAVRAASEEEFDLIVLDWMLPGLDGLEVARRVRATHATPILMLTARADEADRVLGLEVGADDYLTKPFSLREFLARVRAMLRRTQLTRDALESRPEPVSVGNLQIDPLARTVRVAGEATDLTPREYDLLLMLARHPGRTFSRDYLLERVWGPSYEGSDRVVDTTVVRLRRKLGSEGERVTSVWGVGYRLEG
jgi:DNA-binding response OmpR family regulator